MLPPDCSLVAQLKSSPHPEELHTAQIRSSFEHLPLTLGVSVFNSILLGFVMLPVVPAQTLLIWIGLVTLLSAVRIVLWRANKKSRVDRQPKWVAMAVGGTLLSGILWGMTPVLFWPLDEVHLLFLTFVIGGMCAGASTVHAAHFPSVVGFVMPAVMPLAATFFALGGRLQTVSGVMTLTFGIALAMASTRFAQWFRKITETQLNLRARTRELDEINARLTAEVENHRSTAAKLHEAQKLEAIGRLTAGIAHDFNNLLTAISGSAELVQMNPGNRSASERHSSIILQSVHRGSTMTRRLLAFGSQQQLSPQRVDVNELLSGLNSLLTATLTDSRVVFDLEPAVVMAVVDTSQLEQAILNLVINARDAMPHGGTVTIRTENVELAENGLRGRFAQIDVADTGIGMPESIRVRAFDPFFTTKGAGGSGLGLSQVYGLVQQSGGHTSISTVPGEGTTVTIYLPQEIADH